MKPASIININLAALIIFSLGFLVGCEKKPTANQPNSTFTDKIIGTENLAISGSLGWSFLSDTQGTGNIEIFTPGGRTTQASLNVNGVIFRANVDGSYSPGGSIPYDDTLNISCTHTGNEFFARLKNVPLLRQNQHLNDTVFIAVGDSLYINWDGPRVDSCLIYIPGYIIFSVRDAGYTIIPGIVFNRTGVSDILLTRTIFKGIRAGFAVPEHADSIFVLALSVTNKLFTLKVREQR